MNDEKIVVNKTGGPEVLELVNSEAPSISTGQILVHVEAAGVNYIDVYQRTGNLDIPKPFTPGG